MPAQRRAQQRQEPDPEPEAPVEEPEVEEEPEPEPEAAEEEPEAETPSTLAGLAEVTNTSPTAVARQARRLDMEYDEETGDISGDVDELKAAVEENERQGPIK